MGHADSRRAFMPTAVSIGGTSKSELLRALREHNVQLNQSAQALFDDPRFTTLRRPHVVEIVALSVAEFGFGEGAAYGQLIARARASGLVERPLELGPHLRIHFLNQFDGMPLTRQRSPC